MSQQQTPINKLRADKTRMQSNFEKNKRLTRLGTKLNARQLSVISKMFMYKLGQYKQGSATNSKDKAEKLPQKRVAALILPDTPSILKDPTKKVHKKKLDDCASDRSHRSKARSTHRSGSAKQLGSRSGSAKRLIPRSGSAKRGKSPKKKP